MKKVEQLYEGKAKKVFSTEDPNYCIVSYKDDATAFNGQKTGVVSGPYANGGNRDTGGHLNNGQKAVQPIHKGGLDGQSDNGNDGLGGQYASQMGGLSGGGNDDAEALFLSGPGKFLCLGRGAVGRHDPGLKGNAELLQLGDGTLDHGKIAVGAHDDGYFFQIPRPPIQNKKRRRKNCVCSVRVLFGYTNPMERRRHKT